MPPPDNVWQKSILRGVGMLKRALVLTLVAVLSTGLLTLYFLVLGFPRRG